LLLLSAKKVAWSRYSKPWSIYSKPWSIYSKQSFFRSLWFSLFAGPHDDRSVIFNDSPQSGLYDGGGPSPERSMTGITVSLKPTVVKGDFCCAEGSAREAIVSAFKSAETSALPRRFRRSTGFASGYAHIVPCGTKPSRICE